MSDRSERVVATVRRHFGGAVIGALPVGGRKRPAGTRAPISERGERIIHTLRRHFGGAVIGEQPVGVRSTPE